MSTPLKKIVTGVGKRLKIIKSNADYFLDFADYFLDFFFSAFLRLPRSEGPWNKENWNSQTRQLVIIQEETKETTSRRI